MSIQLIIIILYSVLTILVSLFTRKHGGKSAESFTGAGLGVLACVCASTGEWLGGTATTGVSEYGFDFGISGAWYTIANGLGVIFLALVFAELYRSMRSVTVPGIIGKFIGVKARTVSSIFLTFVMLAVGISQMIAAGSLGVSMVGISFNVTVIVFAVVFIIYTISGGMHSVAVTNTMHLAVMYGGVILAVIMGIHKVGGLSQLKASLPDSYFNMTSIGGAKVSSWIIASLLGACTAQAGIQPILAAKDTRTAKKAAIITAFVAAPFGLFTALLGMIAKTLSVKGELLDVAAQNVTSGKLALSALMMNMSPFAGGLVLASILAAILSTISPIILASGTMVTKDLYHGVLKPEASDREVLLVSRITTALSGVVCAGMAIFFNSTGIRVLDIVYFAYSMRGALFVIVILGIYYKKTSEKGALAGMLATAVTGLFWVVYNGITGHFPIPGVTETYAAVVTALVITVLASWIWKKRPADPSASALNKE